MMQVQEIHASHWVHQQPLPNQYVCISNALLAMSGPLSLHDCHVCTTQHEQGALLYWLLSCFWMQTLAQ